MNFDKWVKKYLGKKIDFDGMYGVQCVDLFNCYVDDCLELEVGFFPKYAKQFWTDRNKNAWLKKHFDFITPSYKDGELKKGDIGIRTSGTAGHVFIIADTNKDGRVKYYDQNATGKGDKMTLRNRDYSSATVSGFLRPKDGKYLVTVPTVKPGTYTLTNVRGVYKGWGAKTGRKKVGELTPDGRKHATSIRKTADAYLRANTPITISQTKLLDSGNLWAEIPSGYICVWECDINKLFIK